MSKSHLQPPPALLDFLAPYDHDIQRLALAVRRFVQDHIPPMTEMIVDSQNGVSEGFTPSGRFKDAVCHVTVYPNHVSLGFHRGAELPDPGGHLIGAGKSVRHLIIDRVEDLLAPHVRELLLEAVKLAHVKSARPGVIIKSNFASRRGRDLRPTRPRAVAGVD
jgi:hypothetical protein